LIQVDGRIPVPGTFWAPGDKIYHHELADTFRAIAEGGADAFFQGQIARAMVDTIQSQGGVLTYEDLAAYESAVRVLQEDEFFSYRGLRYTPGASTILVQLLNILENFELGAMGPDRPTYRHIMLETLRRAWINHFLYAGEPGLLKKEYARQVAGLILPDRVADEMLVVDPRTCEVGPLPKEAAAGPLTGGSTTTLAAVDRHGNLFNMLTSLGNHFGSKVVIPGTGIVLNDHMCNFDPVPGRPLSLGPSRRPPQGAHVPVFFRRGRPFLALSAPGARRSMSGVIHVLVHCIDFGMGVQEAIETPRVWAEAFYGEAFVDSRLAESVRRALAEMGHSILSMNAATSGGFGRPTAIMIDAAGKLHGGADAKYSTGVAGF
jgi:gamma-glutamyltranspeptidase/glutathione hydrolase